MKLKALIAVVALWLVPTGASACMSSGPDGYSTGLLWDNEPENVQEGAIVLRLSDIAALPDSWLFTAKVTRGPKSMLGKRYRFTPMNLNSCVGFGARQGYAAVWRTPISLQHDGSEVFAFEVIDYSPTIMNEFLRVLFGGSQWRYPGEPSERYELPQ